MGLDLSDVKLALASDDPGEVFAYNANHGAHFREEWQVTDGRLLGDPDRFVRPRKARDTRVSIPETSRSIAPAAGSKKSSERSRLLKKPSRHF